MKIPKGSSRELTPAGVHNARLVDIVDFGTQPSNNTEWQDTRQINIGFQAVDEKTKDGKAVTAYRQYTFSSSPKSNLMKDLKAWLGPKVTGDFDMDSALDEPCQITVIHKETAKGTFANITNISGVPKSTKVKKATEPLRSFYLDPETFDADEFKALPDWIQTKIAGSPEYAAIIAAKQTAVKKKGKK